MHLEILAMRFWNKPWGIPQNRMLTIKMIGGGPMIKNAIYVKRYMLWYMLCFFVLGTIDQRRGSAPGEVQMAAANCVGLVIAGMLLPSLEWEKFRNKVYIIWTGIALLGGTAASIWGWQYRLYKEQWLTGVLNVVVWGYLIIYILREWRTLIIVKRLRQPFFWCIELLFVFMIVSVYGKVLSLWMLLIFGGFYLIGIPEERRTDFSQGLLNGIILWFFVQQILAFGFRPYDYVRYRGMYSGETQNGIFYMIVYCAFLCKWILAKEKGKHRIEVWLNFLLAAASISFMLFTGGRSSLMGAAVSTLFIYAIYDIIIKKSFYKWMLHVALLGVCVVFSFPVVYSAIRYFPTALHHPIWFEGEYSERSSVRSFDSWDSERYISFGQAVNANIGRILKLIGVDINQWTSKELSSLWTLRVYASEMAEPGSSAEVPYISEDFDRSDAIAVRKAIFTYYIERLSLFGHSKEQAEFYFTKKVVIGHAHNMLIQMAYDYGIFAGIFFLGLNLYNLARLIKRACRMPSDGSWCWLAFAIAIFFYGMTEMAIVPGTITWVLLYLSFYFGGEDVASAGISSNRLF